MADEYIRLDTTIMGIDGLINEAPTGSQARALFCAKDMIYDQQRYVSEMKPVNTKEVLRHLDSLMICIGNAYDTSHYLLESDMEFIEKQEKIIKELLSGEPIKG